MIDSSKIQYWAISPIIPIKSKRRQHAIFAVTNTPHSNLQSIRNAKTKTQASPDTQVEKNVPRSAP